MGKGRLEAFSDGVIAIIITIMVLEMKVPHGLEFSDLTPIWPVFLSYILSFSYIGIYWNNHHHLFQAAQKVNGRILWANLHLLFWLSLFPFATGWMGENRFGAAPVALYGFVLFAAATAYYILTRVLIAHHGQGSALAGSIGNERKEKVSVVLYIVAIPLTLVHPLLSCAVYVAVAALWVVPDQRIESRLSP